MDAKRGGRALFGAWLERGALPRKRRGLVGRMSGRWVHLASGRVYHVIHNPPKTEGKDDSTGETLIQREDDREEIVRKRLAVYQEQTSPLIAFYQRLSEEKPSLRYSRIDGNGSVESIKSAIREALER